MRSLLPRAILAMLVLLPAAAAAGTTLYVNRIVVAGPGDLSMGELVQASGELSAEAREVLARSVGVVADKVLYVPTELYRSQLEAEFGQDAIVVGARSTVIPRGTALEGEAYLIDRLIDYLQTQGLLSDAKAELATVQLTVKGAPPQDGSPVFQATKNAKGGSDITFSLVGSGGGSVTGRFSLAVAAPVPGSSSTVNAGTPVNVVFRKGLITIEMPGKALGSAGIGETVTVSIAESQKTFIGQVTTGKAVEVDLP